LNGFDHNFGPGSVEHGEGKNKPFSKEFFEKKDNNMNARVFLKGLFAKHIAVLF